MKVFRKIIRTPPPMRGRYVKREFWLDHELARWPFEVRLTYIGLWAVADDAGWLPDDAEYVAALIYPYVDTQERLALIRSTIGMLVEKHKATRLPCGHVHLSSMEKHLSGGVRQFSTRNKHETDCLGIDANQSAINPNQYGINRESESESESETGITTPARMRMEKVGDILKRSTKVDG